MSIKDCLVHLNISLKGIRLASEMKILPLVALSLFLAFGVARSDISIVQVDSSEYVYTDTAVPLFFLLEPLSVARASFLPLQFVIKTDTDLNAKIAIEDISTDSGIRFFGKPRIYYIKSVHVEANSNNGGTQVGKDAQGPNKIYLTRKAPFDVSEVLVEKSKIALRKNVNNVVLCDLEIPADCTPGVYKGKFVVVSGDSKNSIDFSFQVHHAIMPESYALKTSHWLSTKPQDLIYGKCPEPWSKEHWALIEQSAKTLYDFGDRVVTVPTFYSEDPMVPALINNDGTYDFDFTRFDKWVELFLGLGYEQIECLAISGHWISTHGNVYAIEKSTGNKKLIFPKGYCTENIGDFKKKYKWPKYRDMFAESADYRKKVEEFSEFIVVFFDHMYKHIKEKGWTDVYVQQLLDEPRTVKDYAYMSKLARKHLPGIKISNAIHGYGVDDYEQFSQYLDMWIMEAALLRKAQTKKIIEDRINKKLGTGIYVLAKLSAWPNRILDRPLLDNRTQPWIFLHYGLDSYIHWAANQYRGADPYKTSVGPLPDGSQSPGHPVGGNWIFYPGDNGLIPSMRAVVFREGLIDYTLLRMLEVTDKSAAESISSQISTGLNNNQSDPKFYHIARRKILELLDSNYSEKSSEISRQPFGQ